MITKRLVVSHYEANLDWLNSINGDVEVFIYHKKHYNNLNYCEKVELDNNNFLLPNTGRESHTYLKHIIDNYDNICDLEFFSQDALTEYPTFIDIVNNDNKLIYEQYSTHPYRFTCLNGEYKPNATINSKVYVTGEIREIWDNLFKYDPPTMVEITPHGFIKLPKSNIVMHDIEIYQKCLDYFKDNNVNNLNAWNFEYFWSLLFTDYHKTYK